MQKSNESKVLNALGIIGSVLLSILFVLMAFAVPICYSAADLLSPKTLTTAIQNVDYVEVLRESDKVDQIVEDMGIDKKTADEIMKSEEVGELLEDVSDDLTEILVDPDSDLDKVDGDFLQKYVDKHFDDIFPIIEEKSDDRLDRDEVKRGIDQIVKDNDGEIKETVSSFKSTKESTSTFSTLAKTAHEATQWYYVLAVCLIELIFLGVIYILRKKNFNGFIWIAINTGIVGSLVSCITLVLASGFTKAITEEMPTFLSGIVDSAVGSVLTNLTIALGTCFIIMIGSIAAYIILRSRKRKLDEKAVLAQKADFARPTDFAPQAAQELTRETEHTTTEETL